MVLRWLKTLAHRTESLVTRVSRVSNIIGVLAIAVLMLLVTSDVVGRFVFNQPVLGTAEMSMALMILAVYCAVAYCALVKGHVAVDLLFTRLPRRGQAITESVTVLGSLALFSLITWSSVNMLVFSFNRHEVTMMLDMPIWPFRAVLVIGAAMLCLVLLIDLVHQVTKAVKK